MYLLTSRILYATFIEETIKNLSAQRKRSMKTKMVDVVKLGDNVSSWAIIACFVAFVITRGSWIPVCLMFVIMVLWFSIKPLKSRPLVPLEMLNPLNWVLAWVTWKFLFSSQGYSWSCWLDEFRGMDTFCPSEAVKAEVEKIKKTPLKYLVTGGRWRQAIKASLAMPPGVGLMMGGVMILAIIMLVVGSINKLAGYITGLVFLVSLVVTLSKGEKMRKRNRH